MSDPIKHECGVAMLRLLKPLDYYQKKYGTSFYGLNKMYLLMEKQHNRGQDGAGIANVKLDVTPGKRYISRKRSIDSNPIQDVFKQVNKRFVELEDSDPEKLKDTEWMKKHLPFTGELFLGHLRYGTFGENTIEQCHPFLRQNNWKTRNLVLAGNFNMTNVDELFEQLVDLGQHPKQMADAVTILEKIGHFLDEANDEIYYKNKDKYSKKEITKVIENELNIQDILIQSAKYWDGGYLMCGLLGHGDAFALRDPNAIRPAYYYKNDEIVVVASERPVIQTAFNVKADKIYEIKRGHALIIKKDGTVKEKQVREPLEKKSCSFERIYFSRGNDKEIYNERLELGKRIFPKVLKSIDNDVKNTVFSYIPNTAEVSYFGLLKGCHAYLNKVKTKKIQDLGDNPNHDEIAEIMKISPRAEKIAIKDAKLRTFITSDDSRDDLVSHVYDITYGTVKETDNLVMIDDSIVRGTTLKQSIIRILDRLGPKKIVVVSSAPQIRYPDCYGIDMSKMGNFIAFQAAVSLLKERGKDTILTETYNKCKSQEDLPKEQMQNHVKEIYKPFTADDISKKISELLTPEGTKAQVEIIYQSISDLHDSCPNHLGDWYFTGDYPTPGGTKVVNKSFINYMEGNNNRAY
ncbi:MAG: amidophosphoribosyltransferase [Flavobacteriales bacterium]|jgi:amidophosphoribosyltransferase|nr:amidophosphoribosyltransferase [Flavobacteriales bacterium]MBT7620263.1 amidophosphoribosyltransferase [Flavobacteriales bacterium]MBT7726080.1 amidophosphoribosyltransferase [Flavobacteriales bacterium]